MGSVKSDTLIDGLAGQLGSVESQTKNALEAYVRSNGGTDMPDGSFFDNG